MSTAHSTSTGHARSNAAWLDAHFQAAQPEYEDSLRYVGMQPGWTVLDAGCGSGGFVPLIAQQVEPGGKVVALDLAPENVARVEAFAHEHPSLGRIETRVGSILSLPFADAEFDCVWSANVMQYLTEPEFDRAVSEFKRVLKPHGTLAIKDFDATHLENAALPPALWSRYLQARRAKYAADGLLGPFCGMSLPSRLRRAGLRDIRRKGWFVERWAPLTDATRQFIERGMTYGLSRAAEYDLSETDIADLRAIASNPAQLLDDPDFCMRECFVVAVGCLPGRSSS